MSTPKNPPRFRPLPAEVEQALQQLGQRLKAHRLVHGLTTKQMTERLFCSTNTYRNLEAGKPSVSLGTLVNTLWLLAELESLSKVAPVAGLIVPRKRGKRSAQQTLTIRSEDLDF